eukprot:3235435-Rhodomonas_salina.1
MVALPMRCLVLTKPMVLCASSQRPRYAVPGTERVYGQHRNGVGDKREPEPQQVGFSAAVYACAAADYADDAPIS